MSRKFVYPGHLATGRPGDVISTILGSCVSVVLGDLDAKVFGLNHYLLDQLPEREEPSFRYGSVAIPSLIEEMKRLGADPKSLRAKIYGGANVLNYSGSNSRIGERNSELARTLLREYSIPIEKEVVGGTKGRSISLDCSTFEVNERTNSGKADEKEEVVDTSGFASLGTPSNKDVSVLIVDDSATVRNVFRKVFEKNGITIAGMAANAFEARELIVKKAPTVLTLDIEMPQMNGVTFLEKLMKYKPMPVVMVSSLGATGEAAMRALDLGAVEFVNKPSQFDPQVLRQLAEMLCQKVRAAASQKVVRQIRSGGAKPVSKEYESTSTSHHTTTAIQAICVGGNTGAQNSMIQFFENLQVDSPPVIVSNSTVSPIAESYIKTIKKKNPLLNLKVAEEGDVIRDGFIYLAPENAHIAFEGNSGGVRIKLLKEKPVSNQIPSSDVMFESAASVIGQSTLGVLFSGFGSDGTKGFERLKAKGAMTVCESPDDASFPYVPQSAIAQGLVDHVLSTADISQFILNLRNRRVA